MADMLMQCSVARPLRQSRSELAADKRRLCSEVAHLLAERTELRARIEALKDENERLREDGGDTPSMRFPSDHVITADDIAFGRF